MTDLLSALRWWAALTLLGLAALPLIYTLLRPLPDRGYAFVKMAGLLLVSTVFWLCLLYTSPSPRDGLLSRMPSSA